MLIGYARVSSAGQSLDVQVAQLKLVGCDRIVEEMASGARMDHRRLPRVVSSLAAGDTLVVTRLDRLARSTRDLLLVVEAIVTKNASLRSLGDPWADPASAHGRLFLTVLGGLAEFERSLIHSRTSEGRVAALQSGVKFGRKPRLTAHQQAEAISRRELGECHSSIAKSYNVSRSTISRLSSRREQV